MCTGIMHAVEHCSQGVAPKSTHIYIDYIQKQILIVYVCVHGSVQLYVPLQADLRRV